MGFTRSFITLLLSSIVVGVDAGILKQHKHEAQEVVPVARRQVGLPVQITKTPSPVPATTSPAVLAYITPSPGAAPVAITKQSQLVSSFIAKYTLCELPPLAFFPITPITPLPSTLISTAPYRNYSISTPPGNGSCTTIFEPTQTMVCNTTITGLVQQYTVSNCAQDITFSSEYGYALAYPTPSLNSTSTGTGIAALITPAPTIQTLTTYYLAPWQSVTAGQNPSDVTLKVCTTFANGTDECIHQYEVWHTSLLTQVATTTTSVNISTTIHGLSKIIVETFAANVTDKVTTFTMTTEMEWEYETEVVSTQRETKPAESSTSASATITSTITVEKVTPTPSSSSALTTTRTSTLRRTISTTVYVGTSTSTLPGEPTVVDQPTETADFVSLLGIPTAV